MQYSAFISYSHHDRDWAVWLHKSLERYGIPKKLHGLPAPWGEIGNRLPPVFRDRDELATSSDLGASVREALEQAATLVVVCSPNSAKSKWVDEEIRTFVSLGRAQFIRLIIIDGEPHSSDPKRECLPPSLIASGAPEPLAADVRKEADGRQGAKLKVIAGVLGVPYDNLRQREAARRQRRLAVLATASLAGFVVMAGLTVFALISRAEAINQRYLAERRTATAERTIEFVQGMFEHADPSTARGETITAREIVDRGASDLDTPALKSEPIVRAELGVTLSQVYGALGLYRKSDALVRRTFGIAHNEPATLARQLNALGESQVRLGDYESAEATFRRAFGQAGTASPTLRARILAGLGQSLSYSERFQEAGRVFHEALRIDRSRGESGGNDVARDLEGIGNNLYDSGKPDLARPFIEQALALRLRFEGPNSPSISDGLNTLGEIAYSGHQLRAAERYFRGNLAVDERVLGRDHPDHATTLNNLARTLIEQQRYREAAPLLERAIVIAEPERGAAHDSMAFLYSNLAIVRRHMGALNQAETLFEKSIVAARANHHRTLGPNLADLAELLCASGRAREGLALLDEAMLATASDYPEKPWRTAWVENIKGECLFVAGRTKAGREAIARSFPVILREWPRGTLYETEARRRASLEAHPAP